MKKIFFSLLAIAAVASCAKTETDYIGTDSEIKLAPVTAKQTKANVLAAIDGTTYPVAENFDVYAYWKKGAAAGETYTDGVSYLSEGTTSGVEFVNKGNYWGGAKTYYWPKNGALRFAAYSPSSIDMTHNQEGDIYAIDEYENPSSTAATWDLLVAPTSESYTTMTATENVSVVFKHALSWITLKVKTKNADAAGIFDVKKVTINGINTKAKFEASMLDGIQYEEWSGQNTPAEYVVFEGSQKVTAEATDIETTAAGTLVIPQETTNVTVVFNQAGVNGTLDMEDMEVNLDLVLDTDESKWLPGHHYTYTLIFDLDVILINPSIEDWTEVVVGELDVDAANVSTETQLEAAIKKGGKVTLQKDIALSADKTLSIARGNVVELDLNGHVLSAESTKTGANYNMFDVRGNLTVNNGTLTTEHTGANMEWNNSTNIFNVTDGGVLNLNDVVAKNLGGSDMGFVAHLNNWGKVTLNADRSTLESNYVALRLFNSGNDMNNVSIYNSTLKGGSYAFWVHNYTVADLGSDAKVEAQKALLNLDIFNGTNTFIGKNLTPIRYGMTDAIYCDEDGLKATPAATQEALNDALADGGRVRLAAGEYTIPAGSSFTAETVLVCEPGTVFTGTSKLNINGATIVGAEFSNPSGTAVDQTINGVFKECTFTGVNAARWCYSGETVVFEDCVFDGSTYGVHFDGGANEVLFRNCTISGFNALAGTIKMTTFEGCTFKSNGKSGYNGANLWGAAKMIGCEFTFDGSAANEWIDCIDATKTYELTNCTVNGVALTDANVATYPSIFSRNDAVVKINGVDCVL